MSRNNYFVGVLLITRTSEILKTAVYPHRGDGVVSRRILGGLGPQDTSWIIHPSIESDFYGDHILLLDRQALEKHRVNIGEEYASVSTRVGVCASFHELCLWFSRAFADLATNSRG